MGERRKHVLTVRDDELDVRHNRMMMHQRLLREGHMWECPVDGQVGRPSKPAPVHQPFLGSMGTKT
jgi:hypothetical protein